MPSSFLLLTALIIDCRAKFLLTHVFLPSLYMPIKLVCLVLVAKRDIQSLHGLETYLHISETVIAMVVDKLLGLFLL